MHKQASQIWRTLLTVIMSVFMLTTFIIAPVKADLTDYQTTCSTTSISADCTPLKISDIQALVAKVLSLTWSLGAVVFFCILLFNGLVFLLGSWEDAEYILGVSIKDAKKRMTQWGTGFFMFFLSYPLMNTALNLVVGDSDCYANLKQPGFTFFFPNVCEKIVINNATVAAVRTNISEDDLPEVYSSTNTDGLKACAGTISNVSGETFCVNNCGELYSTLTAFKVDEADAAGTAVTTRYIFCSCKDKTSPSTDFCREAGTLN